MSFIISPQAFSLWNANLKSGSHQDYISVKVVHNLFSNNREHVQAVFVIGTVLITIVFLGKFNGKANVTERIRNFSRWLSAYLPFSLIFYLYKFRKDGVKFFEDYIAEHGPVSKIARNLYVVSDADLIQKILTSNDWNHLHKTKLARIIFQLAGIEDGLVSAGPNIWAKHRKLLSPSFSYKSLISYLETMDTNARQMVEEVKSELEFVHQQSFGKRLKEIIGFYTIKTMSSVLLGSDLATDEENSKFRTDFECGKELAMYRIYRPWLLSDMFWQFYPERKQLKSSQAGLRQFVFKMITKFKEDMKTSELIEEVDIHTRVRSHRAMIKEMLQSGMSDEEILAEVLTFLFAGHESTTTQINHLLFHLALNPKDQLRCQTEIDSHVPEPTCDLKMEDLANLKHLERCILESLRLTPAFPLIMRRIESSIKIDEFKEIKGGSDVLIPVWTIHRNPEYYKNPLKFDPDRFLPQDCKSRGAFTFLPFSSGPRNCIGWKLAIMEIKVVVARILQNFDVTTTNSLEDIKFIFEVALKPEKDIDIKLKKRMTNI